MQITIGARCWDGTRSKTLSSIAQIAKVEIIESSTRYIDKLIQGAKRLNDPKVKAILGFGVPVVLFTRALQSKAFAAAAEPEAVTVMSDATKGKILHAFDPLIHLIQSLSYPIAGVMIAGGCLFIMVGNREQGMKMLQNAAIGYILVQLSPTILELLVGIGSSV